MRFALRGLRRHWCGGDNAMLLQRIRRRTLRSESAFVRLAAAHKGACVVQQLVRRDA